ncbi:unnamed protein product [Schistosoma margrebowiei]|uniref:PLD phosphodiesterase domain-containing protein n=1 Tax=Schistosoma margrebowiei TaxID=48269 RepID=A0A3P8BCY3_9TREM|nr:unnamed protein product [Schistosoma margrebowiei]
MHTKLWSVDTKNGYVGSANMDWRSLTQVKELGVLIYNCPEMMNDLEKIWKVYWSLGNPNGSVPQKWPEELATNYNRSNPLITNINEDEKRMSGALTGSQTKLMVHMGSSILKEQMAYKPIVDHWLPWDYISSRCSTALWIRPLGQRLGVWPFK